MPSRDNPPAPSTVDTLGPVAHRLYSGRVRRIDASGRPRTEQTEVRFLNEHQASFQTKYPAHANDPVRLEVTLHHEGGAQVVATIKGRVLADLLQGACLVALSPHSRISRRLRNSS